MPISDYKKENKDERKIDKRYVWNVVTEGKLWKESAMMIDARLKLQLYIKSRFIIIFEIIREKIERYLQYIIVPSFISIKIS